MTHKALRKKVERQRGSIMIQLMLYVVIASILSVGYSKSKFNSAIEAKGESYGSILNQLNTGLYAYINTPAVSTALCASVTGTGSTTIAADSEGHTIANPLRPTIAELRNYNPPSVYSTSTLKTSTFLDANFPNTPPNDGSFGILIEVTPPPSGGADCGFITKAWFSNPLLDSRSSRVDFQLINSGLKKLGGNGGYSMPVDPTMIKSGSWSVANPDSAQRAGIFMAVNGVGGSYNLNYVRMHDIRPVTLDNTLNVLSDISSGSSACARSKLTNAGVISVADSGCIQTASLNGANGTLTAQGITLNSVVAVGASCPTNGAMSWALQGTNYSIVRCSSNVWASAGGLPTSAVGASCSPDGTPAVSGSGAMLICSGGTFVSAADRFGKIIFMNSYVVSDSSFIPKPICSSGSVGTAAYLLAGNESQNIQTINRYTQDVGTGWYAYMRNGSTLAAISGDFIAQTYCLY
jgi:hypothetical protein